MVRFINPLVLHDGRDAFYCTSVDKVIYSIRLYQLAL